MVTLTSSNSWHCASVRLLASDPPQVFDADCFSLYLFMSLSLFNKIQEFEKAMKEGGVVLQEPRRIYV